jgi:hypothetical protein
LGKGQIRLFFCVLVFKTLAPADVLSTIAFPDIYRDAWLLKTCMPLSADVILT